MGLVTVEKAREYMDLQDDKDDSVVSEMIEYASSYIEQVCNRTFIQAAFTEYYHGEGGNILFLDQRPVSAITSIHISTDEPRVYDSTTLIASSAYSVDTNAGMVHLFSDIFEKGFNTIQVIYTAGYTQANVPNDLQLACIKLVQRLFTEGKTTLENPDLLAIALDELSQRNNFIQRIIKMYKRDCFR